MMTANDIRTPTSLVASDDAARDARLFDEAMIDLERLIDSHAGPDATTPDITAAAIRIRSALGSMRQILTLRTKLVDDLTDVRDRALRGDRVSFAEHAAGLKVAFLKHHGRELALGEDGFSALPQDAQDAEMAFSRGYQEGRNDERARAARIAAGEKA